MPEALEGNVAHLEATATTKTTMKAYMYILQCSDGSYYTGSTVNLKLRIQQHQNGEGANHTKKHLPIELVYFEEYDRIDEAFYREKQVQGWNRKKKEALINSELNKLPGLAMAYRDVASRASATAVPIRNSNMNRDPEPEALEGSDTEPKSAEPEALEGSASILEGNVSHTPQPHELNKK